MGMQRTIVALSLRDSFPNDVLPDLKGVEIMPFGETAQQVLDGMSGASVPMERGVKTFDFYSHVGCLQEKPEGHAAFLRIISREVFEDEVRKKLDPKKYSMVEMPGWLDNVSQNRQP
jgi:hypothetical protein